MAEPRPRRRSRRHAPPEARRAQILDAALRCFSENGYQGTTMDDVARAAGLSKGSLYWHFESKDDVFLSLAEQLSGDLFHTWHDAESEGRPVLEVIEATSRAFLEMTASRTYLLAWIEMLTHRPARERIGELYRGARAQLAELLQRGVDRGELKPRSPALMAGAFTASLEGLLFVAAVDPSFDPRAHWEEVWTALTEGIAA